MKAATAHATSSAEGHREHPWYLAHHFDSIDVQNHAVRLGMWLFLGTEVLLFAGLFLGYTVYRWLYHPTFKAASHHLSLTAGGVNTVILLVSSFFVAVAYHRIKQSDARKCATYLFLTILCAGAFLVIKYFEYKEKFAHGLLPGAHYTSTEIQLPGANLFFAVYFLATGLHAFHVIVGATILGILMVRVMKGKYSAEHYVPVELGALYWHLVDLIWIFLFPLLYLI